MEVQHGMRPVSDFRKTARPFLIAPFGPSQPYLIKDYTPAYSGAPPSAFGNRRFRFGSTSLENKMVNPAGYLATWEGQPVTPPPSWNYLLRQGNNTFLEGINSPKLSNVGKFGNKPKKPKKPTKKPKKPTKKPKKPTKKAAKQSKK